MLSESVPLLVTSEAANREPVLVPDVVRDFLGVPREPYILYREIFFSGKNN